MTLCPTKPNEIHVTGFPRPELCRRWGVLTSRLLIAPERNDSDAQRYPGVDFVDGAHSDSSDETLARQGRVFSSPD